VSAPPPPPKVSPFRLVGTLAGAGALAGFALVFAYEATLPRIEAHKAAALERAIREVLHDPARFEALYVSAGKLTPEAGKGDHVWLGYDAEGRRVGFAIAAQEPGFQDTVSLIFGYDPATKKLLGMRVLESRETPGLGDKIEKDLGFIRQFDGVEGPPRGVKAGMKQAPDEVDMITGATISSRTVLRIIGNALKKWGPLLDAYTEKGP